MSEITQMLLEWTVLGVLALLFVFAMADVASLCVNRAGKGLLALFRAARQFLHHKPAR